MTDGALEALLDAGKTKEALELAFARLAAARASGAESELAQALLDEARAQQALGHRDEAVLAVDEAVTEARRAYGRADARYAESLEVAAEVNASADLPHVAQARFREALEVLDAAGVKGAPLAHTLTHHGEFRQAQGDVIAAGQAFLAALEAVRDVDDRAALAERAHAYTGLAQLALEGGKAPESRALGERALTAWIERRETTGSGLGDSLLVTGSAAIVQGDAEAGAAYLELGCRAFRGAKNSDAVRERLGLTEERFGAALLALGKRDEARAAYERAIAQFREGDPRRMALEERVLELSKP